MAYLGSPFTSTAELMYIRRVDHLEVQVAALEAERDALRKSIDQLADTLKNVHEAVCETLGIEGDDALPELVAEWAEGEYAALRKVADAAENLVKVKGRFHSEQAYQRLVAAIAVKEPK